MNQKCKVCGEPAAGFHFGAFTCEGCKSFFGRTYSNLSAVGECKNGGDCVINKKNRTSCKACRLRKCILVGMSKNGSRYGRRSNWFKIHCLLQEQTGIESPFTSNPLTSSMYSSLSPGSIGHTPSIDGSSGARKSVSPDSSLSADDDIPEEPSRVSPCTQTQIGQRGSPITKLGRVLPLNKAAESSSGLLTISSSPAMSPIELASSSSVCTKMADSTTSHNVGLLAIASSTSIKGAKRWVPPEESSVAAKMARLPKMAEPCSPKAGLVASYHLKIESRHSPLRSVYEPRYSADLLDEGDVDAGEEAGLPQQDNPIDLSFKAATAAPSGGSICHLLSADMCNAYPRNHNLTENDAAPLDLTTKG